MLLTVDIGNTNIKFGVFVGEHLLSKFTIPTAGKSHPHELSAALGSKLDSSITDIVVCSVVPELDALLGDFLSRHLQTVPVFVTNDVDVGLTVNYDPLCALGTDRLVNAFAASQKFGVPCIVCSFGTATTFDVVDRDGALRGGVIAPGMHLMAKALHLNTAKLPEVDVEKPAQVIGSTTVQSIQSGIFNGHIAMVEGMIVRLKNELADVATVIATGGLAWLISDDTDTIDAVEENLTLDGLRLLHERR